MPSEAQARIVINKLLEEAGWRFFPDKQGRRENIVCEHRVTKKIFAPNVDLGADFEHAPLGFVDYVLLNTDGRPVAVPEREDDRSRAAESVVGLHRDRRATRRICARGVSEGGRRGEVCNVIRYKPVWARVAPRTRPTGTRRFFRGGGSRAVWTRCCARPSRRRRGRRRGKLFSSRV